MMSASRVSARLATRKVKQEPPDSPPPPASPRKAKTPSKSSSSNTPQSLSKQNLVTLPLPHQQISSESQDESLEEAEEEEEVPVIQSPVKRRPGPPPKQAKGYKSPTDDLSSARLKLSDLLTHIARDSQDDEFNDDDNTDQSLSPPAKMRKIRSPKK